MKLNLIYIKNVLDKYYFFLYNTKTKKIKLIESSDETKKTLKKIIKRLKKEYIIVRVKISIISKKDVEREKKSILKTIGGPIYGLVTQYRLEDKKLTKLTNKIKNKVYFPSNYLNKNKDNNNKLEKDIMKIALYYSSDRLNNKLMAINKVNKLL
jgi:hypothetical protein